MRYIFVETTKHVARGYVIIIPTLNATSKFLILLRDIFLQEHFISIQDAFVLFKTRVHARHWRCEYAQPAHYPTA